MVISHPESNFDRWAYVMSLDQTIRLKDMTKSNFNCQDAPA